MDENAIYGLISSYCDLDVNVVINNSTMSLLMNRLTYVQKT